MTTWGRGPCKQCGAAASGMTGVYRFCSKECLDAWEVQNALCTTPSRYDVTVSNHRLLTRDATIYTVYRPLSGKPLASMEIAGGPCLAKEHAWLNELVDKGVLLP